MIMGKKQGINMVTHKDNILKHRILDSALMC